MTQMTPTVTTTRPRRLPVSIIITVGVWALCTLAVFPLSHGTLPFQLKLFDDKGTPFLGRIFIVEGSLFLALGMMGLAYLVTIRRPVPDMASRAPAVPIARAETLGMVGYAIVAQVAGAFLGHAISSYAISLHMPGTLYGLSGQYTPRAAIIWAIYNFVVYAVVPFAYFRWRGYSLEQLNLRSNNLRADIVLIVIIFVVESTAELLSVSTAIFSLSGRQLLLGAMLSFVLNFFGTVLPIMIFIYCILLPRYLKLTNSVALTVILGGVSYAAVHVGDSWTNYSSLATGLLSIIVVFIQYFGPGMVKSVLTLRTGNAWVHAWAYHAIDPHVLLDTPTVVDIFQIPS
jgi:hypothetical protein